MDRFCRLITDRVARVQMALVDLARGIREKTLILGQAVAVVYLGRRWVPARVPVRPRQRGFTLIELIISLVVAAVLIGVGVPSYNTFIKNNRIKSEFGDLSEALNVARSEAAKKAATVRICARVGDLCSANVADWKNGWIVFHDRDADNTVDANEILHDHTQPFAAVVVQHATVAVDFNPAGDVAGGAKTFYVCDNRVGSYGRKVEVASSGRVSVDPTKVDITQSKIDSGQCV